MSPDKITYKELLIKNEELRNIAVFQDNCNENVFKQLSEHIDDVFWLRTDNEMIYINPAFEKVWGIPCAEIYQKPQIFTDSIHPDDKKKVLEILKSDTFIKTGHFEYEYRIIRPDKQIRWVHAKSLPVLNDKGEITRRVGVARDITEQKKSQKETSLLAEMLDIAPNSITVHDDTGKFLFANQKTFEIHGYSKEEFLLLTLRELDVPESADLIKERIKAIQENGQAKFEVEHYKKDGSKIPLEVFVKLVDWKGKSAMLSIATDISDRKKILNDLLLEKNTSEKSRQFYKVTFDEAAVGIAHVYPDGKLFKVNTKFCEITGYSTNELVEINFADITHPDDLEKEQVFIKKVLANEIDSFTIEKRYRHKKGHFIWIILYSNVVRDSDGKIEFAVCTITDITIRKNLFFDLLKSKEKAEESEYKVRNMFENTEIGIIYCNSEGKILEANPAILDILGSPSLEASKKINLLTFEPLLKIGFAQDLAKCIKEKQKIIEDIVYKSKWGKTVFMKYYLVPVIINNKVVGVWVNLNNLTDLWKIQNELIAAKEKAEEANRLKSEFLANMSHEIRTPMNGIIGFSEILDKPNITNEKRSFCAKIVQDSSHQLLKIIDDILEISTLETKQTTLNNTEFDLGILLSELHSIFSLKAKDKNITLRLTSQKEPKSITLITDKSKLYKIISNLIENALRFTNEGYVEIGYKINGKDLIVYVKDTGIGISKENQEIIFERFSQEEKEMSRKYGGLGLGLSISKENAHLLGGDITLESEKSKGSTFYLTLPYQSVEAKKDNISKNINDIKRVKDKYTILVAEDEEVNYIYIEVLFEDEIEGEYNLLHAKNGKEAVEICTKNNNIDLVLMDIKMPIMNGHEATEKIKEKFPNLPIIAQTAYSTETDKQLALKHGCDDFISKPINKEKLFGLINKYLKVK